MIHSIQHSSMIHFKVLQEQDKENSMNRSPVYAVLSRPRNAKVLQFSITVNTNRHSISVIAFYSCLMTTIYILDIFKHRFYCLGKVHTAWLRIYFFVLTLISVERIKCRFKMLCYKEDVGKDTLRGCLHGEGQGQPYPLGTASPTKRAGFHLAFTWEKLALLPGLARLAKSPGLTTLIFPRNPEPDICVQVFILYPTHKQTELVK